MDAFTINGGRATAQLPITEKAEGGALSALYSYLFFTLAMPAGIYLYFQSLAITVGLLLFSACSLYINDAINPRRHPAINIFQAVVYAVVFALLR